jgi:hypothetical protein
MLDELDALIDEAVVFGELAAGTDAQWLTAARGADARLVAVLNPGAGHVSWAPAWTEQEEAFVRENHMWMSNAELAKALGRSVNGIEIHSKRNLGLPGRSNTPGYLTAQDVRKALGIGCAKSVTRLIRLGLLPGRLAPLERLVYLVKRDVLVRWAVNPENWIYFKPDNVTDPQIKCLYEYAD